MQTKKLKDLCSDIISGGTPSTKEEQFWNGKVPWITSADINGTFSVAPKKFITDNAKSKILPANNILVVTRVGLGKIATNPYPLAFSQDIQGLVLKKGNCLSYLLHALSIQVLKFKDIGRGATIKGVTRDDLENIEIPLPDLRTQQEIAQVLEQADKARQQRKAANALTDQFLQSSFLSLFGDPVKNEKGWEVKTIKDSGCNVQIGPFGTQLHAEDYIENGIPLINPKNIQEMKVVEDASFTITENKYKELPNYHLKIGDVIMGRRGEMGRCAVIYERENGWFCGTGSLFIRPSKKFNPTYLLYVLSSSSIRERLENDSQGVTMANLNKSIINNLLIPIPPLSLEQQFAGIVAQAEQLRQKQRESERELELLFQSLLQKYFG